MTKINPLVIFLLLWYMVGADLPIIFPNDYGLPNPTPYNENGGRRRQPFPQLNAGNSPQVQNSQPETICTVVTVNNAATEERTNVPNTMNRVEMHWSNHVNHLLSQGVTRFALHMDHAIDANQRVTSVGLDRENVIFSPLNLAGTLAVVMLGSAGSTFNEIVNILGFEIGVDISEHSEIVHYMLGQLLNSIKFSSDTGSIHTELLSAGSIFVQNGYSIRPEFAAIARNVYKNDVIKVDFNQNPSLAQQIINNWVDSKTRGKISSILPEPPSRASKVILASALYFNGEWNQQFFKGATKRKPFYLASGQTINVDMMYNGGEFPFYEDKQLGVKILGLPYKDSDSAITGYSLKSEATMYVLLPTATNNTALDDLESRITPEVINSLINKMITTTCIIAIPRMKLSSTLSLNSALQSLGLTSLFTPGVANLGLLSTGLDNTQNPSPSNHPEIGPRTSADAVTDPITPTTTTTTTNGKNFTGRPNYIRYKDSYGGYDVQQWSNGVYIEKIHRNFHKRHANLNISQSKEVNDSKPIDVTPSPSLVDFNADNDQTRNGRNRRQNRPIDPEFLQFIKSKGFASYGLDVLRNSGNLVNPGLYASDVLHKVEIDITETGTVAAAASGVIIAKTGGQKIFNANHPFLFFIRHDPSNLILFWGTVNKPIPNY